MIKIENYSEKYIESFTNLFNQWGVEKPYTEEELSKSIEDTINLGKNEVIIALGENEELLGYALFGKNYLIGFEPFIEIWQIIVDERRRSTGVGAKLAEYVEKYAAENDFPRVKLSSQVQRERAHKFYKKSGYEIFRQSYFFEKRVR